MIAVVKNTIVPHVGKRMRGKIDGMSLELAAVLMRTTHEKVVLIKNIEKNKVVKKNIMKKNQRKEAGNGE